jgi:hypothetical protein
VLLVLCPLFWDHQLKSLRMQGGTKVMEAPGKGPMRTLRSHYHIYICLKLAPSKIQFKFILLPVIMPIMFPHFIHTSQQH